MSRPAHSKRSSFKELLKDCLKKPKHLRKDDAWNEHTAKGLGFPTSLGTKPCSSLQSSFTEILHEGDSGAPCTEAKQL